MAATDAVVPHRLLMRAVAKLEELPRTASLRAKLKACVVPPLPKHLPVGRTSRKVGRGV